MNFLSNRRGRAALQATTALVSAAALILIHPAHAADATWLDIPHSLDFNDGANWSTGLVPTGTAFFGASHAPLMSTSSDTAIDGWTFNAGASNYLISNSHRFDFNGAGIVVNGGSVILKNTGRVYFLSGTAGSATIDNDSGGVFGAGILTFNDSTAGSATITSHDGGGTIFLGASTAGSSTIINNYAGGALFGGTATAGSATIINNSGGSTGFAQTSTAGNATIINNAGGTVSFRDSGTGGTARLINDGVVDLTYLFDAPGVTLGSIEGSGVFQLATKNLAVGGNNRSTTFSGAILDQGSFPNPLAVGASLTKEGTGTLTLTGTANAYTGATTVNGGTLVVNGSIETSSLVTVNSGGTLAGTGTVGNTAIAGGIFAPGSGTPGSSMSVNGSLGLSPTSTYAVNIDPMTSSFAKVTGVATPGGATVNAYAAGSNVRKQYTILTATGGIDGTFGVVNSNLPANFTTALSYDSNNAYLDVSFGFAPPPGGFSTNQNNVANAVMNAFNTNGIPLAFGALSPQGLTQASGELGTGTQQATFDAMSLFMGVMTDPFMSGRGESIPSSNGASSFAADDHEALGYAARGNGRNAAERNAYAAMARKALPMAPSFEQRWSVWAASYGGSQTTSGNSVVGSNTATSSLYGMALGADYRLSPDTLLGFAMAGGATNFNVAGGLGSGRSDLFQAGAFVHHHIGAAYLSGALAYGWQDVTTDRTVTAGGIERLRANFNANAFSGRLEGGYRIATPLMGITPYAAGQFTTYDLPAYAEQASTGGLFALNYAAKNVTASRSELGLRTDKSFAMQDAILTVRGRAAWAHNFSTDRAIAATFQSLPGASFVVNGAQQAREAALLTGSAEMKWANGFALAATFEGEFSDTTSSYAGKGVVSYSW